MSWIATSVATSVIGIGYSAYQGRKAEKAAEGAAAEEARIEGEVTQERLAQIEREEMLTREATVAGAVGQGIRTESGSVLEVLADQAAQFERERTITEEVGASRATAALARGESLSQQIRAGTIASTFSGLANTAQYASQVDWSKAFGRS